MDKDVLAAIAAASNTFSKGQHRIANYITNNYEKAAFMTAGKLGKSRPTVANALRLLQLPESIQESVRQDKISAGHARTLLSVEDPALQMQLHDAIVEKHLSVRETEAAAEYCKTHGDLPASLRHADEAPRTRPKTTQEIKRLQKSLRALCGKKISISGDGTSGFMRIPYASEEELRQLADLLSGKSA